MYHKWDTNYKTPHSLRSLTKHTQTKHSDKKNAHIKTQKRHIAHIKQSIKGRRTIDVNTFLSTRNQTITSNSIFEQHIGSIINWRTESHLRTNKSPFVLSYLHKDNTSQIYHHSVLFVASRYFCWLTVRFSMWIFGFAAMDLSQYDTRVRIHVQ